MDSDFVDAPRCADLTEGRRLEWLVTNGRGGFASACVNQMLTRRYHGLLVAAVNPPVERFVLLAKLEATATVDGLTYDLATNDYPEAVHPRGHRLLESFELRPFPIWRWRTGAALIEQTLCMVEGEDTVFVRYRLIEGASRVRLTVRPLCTSRHFHHLAQYQQIGPPNVDVQGDLLSLYWPGDRPVWHLSYSGRFQQRPDWYYGFTLEQERERGYDASQDLFMPGPITAELECGDDCGLVFAASTEKRTWKDYAAIFAAAAARGSDDPEGPIAEDPLARALSRAAGEFLVARNDSLRSVIAGYPWFGDWGRDTFISLPGLCLTTGRFEDARNIIEAFSVHVEGGMVPNRFPDYGEPPTYDTADASLWFVHAVERYLAYTEDWEFTLDRAWPAVAEILDAHVSGTRFGIGLCEDGLLAAGEPGFALTWMDAKLPDGAATPRIGKPVEINALWCNALRIGATLADRAGDDRARRWRRIAEMGRLSFNASFWNDATGCLYDVIDADGVPGRKDGAIRPNQLFAVSLPDPVLDVSRRRSVVDVCERELWTPMGLRTLAPGDSRYVGRYQGDVAARDRAYHQGTVWPWLLGPFVSAFLNAYGSSEANIVRARGFLDGLAAHLSEAGLGGISEVADGDAPHGPGGCPWQAWSVAEPLRALCEDIHRLHPSKLGRGSSPRAAPSAVRG